MMLPARSRLRIIKRVHRITPDLIQHTTFDFRDSEDKKLFCSSVFGSNFHIEITSKHIVTEFISLLRLYNFAQRFVDMMQSMNGIFVDTICYI